MKLIKAICWYFTQDEADGFVQSKVFQLMFYFVIGFALLVYFFITGLQNGNQTQYIGCGIGLFLILIPIYTWSQTLLLSYDDRNKNS